MVRKMGTRSMALVVSTLVLVARNVSFVESFVPLVKPRSLLGVSSDVAELCAVAQTSVQRDPKTNNFWQFRGHEVYSQVTVPSSSPDKPKPVVVLLHGFGCSTTYWRATTAALADAGYTVHAIDLLGQGRSAKPGLADGIEYSISLWADQCDAYIRDNIPNEEKIVLIGNSLGSLVALSAVTGDFVTEQASKQQEGNDSASSSLQGRVRGIGMFNCGVGLNSRGIAKEPQMTPLQRFLINAIFDIVTALVFKNEMLLTYILDKVVTRELLRDTLQSLYRNNPDRVDDDLIDSFYWPAKDDGSVEALSQIYCNDPGKTPFDLHAEYPEILSELPIHLVWGDDDAVTPIVGGVGQFYTKLAQDEETRVSLDVIQQCGHVPFDDCHIESNESMLQWLARIS